MEIVDRIPSPDGITVKFLQRISGGVSVETTYIDRAEKHILCFSSQVGCVVQCGFCASGIVNRYKRSLTSGEMFQQCLNVIPEMRIDKNPKPLLFSCMGEGEPFLNFEACVATLHRLARIDLSVPIRLAVSTSGIKPELIRRLGEISFLVPLKLQISLHGPTDEIRQKIVPITSPLDKIVEAVRAYVKLCNRPVDWNYVMCQGINDDLSHATLLVNLLGSGWHVKFNRLNPTNESPFLPTPKEKVDEFRKVLENSGISTEYYETDGSDIAAACGQLSYHHNTSI